MSEWEYTSGIITSLGQAIWNMGSVGCLYWFLKGISGIIHKPCDCSYYEERLKKVEKRLKIK